ncbi:sensor histidine kinase [Arcticibacter tournemirensis]|uniref:Regulator of cell autolysis n=1 Tax=Arcticibacter tournemirensis TaxID=699437 RepID=A0A4Q0M5B9_9SPHI|nr:histidine kinase [Arcticibacter tournemirensis]RXF68208.1 regulator of cell autolysis [Arcticibacter tournemirensis]
MKPLFRTILFLAALVAFFACNQERSASGGTSDTLSRRIEALENVKARPSNYDSLLREGIRLDKNPYVKKDTVLATKVKYHLARIYGMQGLDSAGFFVGQALELIEPTAGNLKMKALVYNGMGNIRSMEAKEKEAAYYYNKAAAIVLSDSTVGLSAEARSAILLSAAQSNLDAFQYDLAEKMNRAALPLSDSVPEGHVVKQRVLVQLIQTLNKRHKSPGSLLPYLRRLEALHVRNPGDYNASYLYESKILYFESAGRKDSLLHYQLLKLQADDELYHSKKTSIFVNNLFVDYCNVAWDYTELRRPASAIKYIGEADRLRRKHPGVIFADNDVIYQKTLAALYQLHGKHNAAISALKQVAHLQEDIYQTQNAQTIAEMNALYQLQAKDRSIRSLNENIQINKLQLQQNRLWLVVSVLGVVSLGMTLLFLFYSFRQRRLREEKEKLLLQQKLLRTQMEPHFIFNTLSAVQSFVRLDKKEDAIKYLSRFSRLLRSSLELSREDLVPLSEEIDTLENYLSLQQMRSEDAFTYRIVPPQEQDLSAIMLPPMLIQPYVENAILHGIDLHTGEGNIDVRLQIEGEILIVSITDSGKIQMEDSRRSHRSLSGIISRERIQLLGRKASVQAAKHARGSGTVVTLKIPVSDA